MDRRSFLLGLLGAGTAAAGVAALGPLLVSPAEATPLDALKNLAPPEPQADADAADVYGMAPDGTPAESSYWVWRRGRRYWVSPPRRRRRVCRNVWYRGRRVRRCWWQSW